MIAYRCTLSDGHHHLGEPHYAVEVERSVRAWRRWAEQKEREEKSTQMADQQESAEDAAQQADEGDPEDFEQERRRLSEKATQDLTSFVAANSVIAIDDTFIPVEDDDADLDLLRRIYERAQQNLAKDPSLSATLAMWLATEQITRKSRG